MSELCSRYSLLEILVKMIVHLKTHRGCGENLPYARLLFKKLIIPDERNFKGISANMLHYASVRPEDIFIILKNIATAAEQGNFEAMGLLEGSFLSRASALKKEESSDWRKTGVA